MARYRITPKAGGIVAGTQNNGVGTVIDVEEHVAAPAVEAGALVPLDADVENQSEDLGSMKVAELKALAEERGVDIPSDAKKDDLIALLKEAAEGS